MTIPRDHEMRDRIAEIIEEYSSMDCDCEFLNLPELADKILALFKDYKNINEPIMRKCEECEGELPLVVWDRKAVKISRRHLGLFNCHEGDLWIYYWHPDKHWVTLEKATTETTHFLKTNERYEKVDIKKFDVFLKAIPKRCLCKSCKGLGEVPVMHEVDCPECIVHGEGWNTGCKKCNGTGKITIPLTIKDKIEEER